MSPNFVYFKDGHLFFAYRNICKLYVLSILWSLKVNNHKNNVFLVWHGGVGVSQRFQYLEAPGSNPNRVFFFKVGAGTFYAFTFYLKHGLWVALHTVLFSFLFMFQFKFMYVKRTSPDGRKEPALI